MNDIPASPVAGWEISTRQGGDVLAARARGHGIELMLLSRAAGHDPVQIEAWLAELIGVAVETSHNDAGDRQISALLRHALTGLLFSHAELWHHTPDDPPCSLSFVTTNDRVAFGWAGPAEVEVWVDDQPTEGPVIRVRDPDGREAQAIEVESWRRVRVRLAWRTGPDTGAPAAVDIDAVWSGRSMTRTDAARNVATSNVLSEWRSPSWLGQQAPWEETAQAPPDPGAEPMPMPTPPPVFKPPPPPVFMPPPPPVFTPPPPVVTQPPPVFAPPPPAEPPAMAPMPFAAAPPVPEPPVVAPPTPRPAAPVPEPLLMTPEERAAELAPPEPQSPEPAPPPPFEFIRPMQPERPTPPEILRPLEPAQPAEPAPLELIRGMESGPPVAPRTDMEIIRLPEPVTQSAPTAEPAHGPTPPAGPAADTPPWMESATPATSLPSWMEGATPASPKPGSGTDPALTAWAARTAPPRSHAPLRPSRVRRPAWPAEEEPERPWWRRRTPIVIATVILFAVGWQLGGFPTQREQGTGFFANLLTRIGLGPAHYQVMLDSHPQGAWIAVDGKDIARRTPATVEVLPGSHQITLSFTDLGRATYEVQGERDARVSLDAVLWGTLAVTSMDHSVAVKVSVDGAPRGLAPVTVDSLAPGVHQVGFWSPGAGSWNQIVEVRVREAAEVVARPFASPATGMLEVRATENGEDGPRPVAGATVWLDGEKRGVTPLSLDLPRGPHSVRITYRGQDTPVQVIDLPGGNQRFARFELDATAERPSLRVPVPGRLSLEAPTVISAALEGVGATDVREMWLHVSTPEGQWRRYAMNVMKAPGGAVGALVFPVVQLDRRGKARFYVSVATRSGDELFSEIQTALGPANANAASTP